MNHERAGSSQAAFTGVFYRSCSCGQEFKGDAETTFTERDAHIAFMNTSPRVVHACDWDGCDERREHGFVYCAGHLAAETERWLAEGGPANIAHDTRLLMLSDEDAQSLA